MDPIVTDRPDQTEASALVPVGWLQIETGSFRETLQRDQHALTYNTTLFKYGVTNRFELRVIQEVLGSVQQGKLIANGFSPVAIGSKIAIAEESDWLPQISLISHLTFKTGASAYKPNAIAPDFRFTFAHSLPGELSLSYNLGAEWSNALANATGIYSVAIGKGLPYNFGAFVEVYGFIPETGSADHLFDTGLTYMITPNLQVDTSFGLGLSDNAPDFFISGGISWRFKAVR
jgi:hypothetical protein